MTIPFQTEWNDLIPSQLDWNELSIPTGLGIPMPPDWSATLLIILRNMCGAVGWGGMGGWWSRAVFGFSCSQAEQYLWLRYIYK